MKNSICSITKPRVIFSVLAATFFSLLVLIACGGGSNPFNGEAHHPLITGDAWTTCEEGDCFGFIFKSGGNLSLITKYGDTWMTINNAGTWSAEEENIVITLIGRSPMEGTYAVSGGSVTITINGDPGVFTKTVI
ncbi:MAG: hypothetical protein FWE57_03210 [Chitinispirillia bacterium]|nr:hypothetical protein [Chitinispirillia bacterium]